MARLNHKWEWAGEHWPSPGLFKFICNQCHTIVWAFGPPILSETGKMKIYKGTSFIETTIESDCNDQAASLIIEEGWREEIK